MNGGGKIQRMPRDKDIFPFESERHVKSTIFETNRFGVGYKIYVLMHRRYVPKKLVRYIHLITFGHSEKSPKGERVEIGLGLWSDYARLEKRPKWDQRASLLIIWDLN